MRIAADRHHQRGLASAVRADQGDDFALSDLQIDPAQRFDPAVEGAHARDIEHQWLGMARIHDPAPGCAIDDNAASSSSSSTPRYAAMTLGSSRIC